MSSIYDAFFFVQFIIAIGLIFAKFWNAMHSSKLYEMKASLMMVGGYYLCYFIGSTIMFQKAVIDPTYNSLIYGTLFRLESLLLYLLWLFTIIEIFYWWKETAMNPFKRSEED